MRDERLILLSPNSRAIGKRGKCIGKQLTAQLAKLHRERLGMLTGNRSGSLRTISARIHAMSDAHDRNASKLITSKNRTLNGGSATPTRQQRSMNIHNTKRRHMQHLIGQNAAIGSHTENISPRSLERLNYLRRHTIGLNDRQPQLKCLGLNRRRLKLLTTPTNSIGTSNYERNLVPSRNKRSQRRHRKIRRTHKHNTHKRKSPLNNEPRRLQEKRFRSQSNPAARTIQQEQIYPKPKKEPHKSSPLNKAPISEDAPPWPTATRAKRRATT